MASLTLQRDFTGRCFLAAAHARNLGRTKGEERGKYVGKIYRERLVECLAARLWGDDM